MSRLFERFADLALKYDRIFWIVGAVWFWAGVAVYARFIELPYIPDEAKRAFFWAGVGANALWWAVINPKLAERREALSANEPDKIADGNSR